MFWATTVPLEEEKKKIAIDEAASQYFTVGIIMIFPDLARAILYVHWI